MQPAIAFRYLGRFRCIGAACEDHCCGRWRIELDEETRSRLSELARLPDAPAVLSSLRLLDVVPAGEPGVLSMPQREASDECVMFGDDRLCVLQRQYGEEALPLVCSMFPRQYSEVHDHLEVTASVACPEIARLALLADDAVELEPISSLPPRRRLAQRIDLEETVPYRAHFPQVRSVILRLLFDEQHSIDARLFFIAYLAASIHSFYRVDFDAAHGSFPVADLEHQLALILHPPAQQHLAAAFADVPFDPSVGRVITETLAVLARGASPRLVPLIECAIRDCESPGGERALHVSKSERHVAMDLLAAAHRDRRQRLPPDRAARLDSAIARYFINLALHQWFVDASDLFLHHQALLVRLAILRFLVLGQPAAGETMQALDSAIVAVFSTVTRAFDHDPALSQALAEAIQALGPSSPVQAARLLKF